MELGNRHVIPLGGWEYKPAGGREISVLVEKFCHGLDLFPGVSAHFHLTLKPWKC